MSRKTKLSTKAEQRAGEICVSDMDSASILKDCADRLDLYHNALRNLLAAYGDVKVLAKDSLPNWDECEPVEDAAIEVLKEPTNERA